MHKPPNHPRGRVAKRDRPQFVDTTLGVSQIVLQALQSVALMAPVPYLQPAAIAALNILFSAQVPLLHVPLQILPLIIDRCAGSEKQQSRVCKLGHRCMRPRFCYPRHRQRKAGGGEGITRRPDRQSPNFARV